MTERRSAAPLRLALGLTLATLLAGCDTVSKFNPFDEKETPLAGERRPVPQVAPPPPDTVPQPLSALPAAGIAIYA